ncbi:glycosyltransferase family 2 protein [Prosthecobacter sp.]|uniref:glycosyltransferase family 2 protein n=1 Tax=Prosthecobacter sp. TaxID=1965333 RepID=UPI002487C23E|nr:glycosyltransferase family 2 protein [Prosthecobacter sp.]MDI1315123.1 glycosyltransferase family 2 protein [Prosthecobacter sp.]
MSSDPPELLVVMPVYNESASVRKVVSEWFTELENWTERFVFFAINDGSTDGTGAILQQLRSKFGERLEVIERENRGHGQSCLQGYRIAIERGIPYIFQLDSDGQCDPQYFFRFWRNRERFDVIYGVRRRRDDGWRRVIASMVLRLTLLGFARANCADANVPYRLMRTAACADTINRIHAQFFLANVGLAVLLRHQSGIRQGLVTIRFRERYGGEPSVPLAKFATRAVEMVRQLQNLLH